jgi:hypothetical protein
MFTQGISFKSLIILAFVGMTSAVAVAPASAVTITQISDNPGKVFHDIASDGSSVYVQDASTVYSLPSSGGTATSLYSGSYIFGVAVIGANVFWGDAQSGPVTDSQIFRAPKTGGGPATAIYTGAFVGEPIVDIMGLETDGTKLYSADAVMGGVHSLNPDGSGLTQIGPYRYGGFFAGAHQNSIAVGDGMVFIGESGVPTASGCSGLCNPGVYSHSASTLTGSFSTLVAGPTFSGDGVRGIAYGDGTVFATQGDTIYLIDPAGGLLDTLTDSAFHDLRGVTFDDGALYVVDQFGGSGRILRVALNGAELPEPATLLLTLLGMVGLPVARRRKTLV